MNWDCTKRLKYGDQRLTPRESLSLVLAIGLTLLVLYAGLSSKLDALVDMWASDPLRSVGVLMPVAALFFAFRCASGISWHSGTWWGLVGMGLPLGWAWLTGEEGAIGAIVAGQYVTVGVAPTGPLLALYFSGAVLLFGGVAAWKTLRFSLFLLLFVNPVPGVVASFDLQLQTQAALVARAFASLLSVNVEPGLLKMMFAPHLGMFIAPGCDGLRGMAAMLCLSLLIGHYYQLPTWRHLLYVLVAVALAYVMNLVRLCCLVIYYWCALRVDVIAKLGTQIDYLIGGILFFGTAFFLFDYPKKLERRKGQT